MIDLGFGNYYGDVYAFMEGGQYYIAIEDYSGTVQKEISEEFYNAIVKEFGQKKGSNS